MKHPGCFFLFCFCFFCSKGKAVRFKSLEASFCRQENWIFCSGLISISLLIYRCYNLYVVRNHKAIFMRGQIIPSISDGFKSHLHSSLSRTKSGSHFKTIWFFITCTKFLIDRSLPAKMNLLLLLRFIFNSRTDERCSVSRKNQFQRQCDFIHIVVLHQSSRIGHPFLPGIFQLIFFSGFIHNFDTTDCSWKINRIFFCDNNRTCKTA